ncbi:hypothetical protein GGE23_001069 [Rhizobium leguminosarum]|nr:hypothetical protein [Rhizobium leguminosarum]MBB4417625.1 hypothetical protein [Rhizobium leguminosarum]MBB4432470.1 hypothetical protein [Rhizobium esperanzae]MDF9818317.1 hypothetical protein [Rhizobium leguminosarum]
MSLRPASGGPKGRVETRGSTRSWRQADEGKAATSSAANVHNPTK